MEDESQGTNELPAWSAYQEDVAEFFRGLGLQAETNVRLDGARGSHDVDVVVTFQSAGIGVTWVVECKQWKRTIPKERVLVLAGVMEDLGADRGLIVAESGFQAGAIRASQNTSITLTSLEDLTANTTLERAEIRDAAVKSRIAGLYRLTMDLWRWAPPSAPTDGINLEEMIEFAGETFELSALVLPRVIADSYPIVIGMGRPTRVSGAEELFAVLEPHLDELEARAERLAVTARALTARVQNLVDELDAATGALVTVGRGVPDDLREADAEQQLRSFVAAMKRIGFAADGLKASAPQRVRTCLGALMQHLIDNSYVVTETSRPDWDVEEAVIHDHIAQVRAALQAEELGTT